MGFIPISVDAAYVSCPPASDTPSSGPTVLSAVSVSVSPGSPGVTPARMVLVRFVLLPSFTVLLTVPAMGPPSTLTATLPVTLVEHAVDRDPVPGHAVRQDQGAIGPAVHDGLCGQDAGAGLQRRRDRRGRLDGAGAGAGIIGEAALVFGNFQMAVARAEHDGVGPAAAHDEILLPGGCAAPVQRLGAGRVDLSGQ